MASRKRNQPIDLDNSPKDAMSTRSSSRLDLQGPKTRQRSSSTLKKGPSSPTKTRKLTFQEEFKDPPDCRKIRRTNTNSSLKSSVSKVTASDVHLATNCTENSPGCETKLQSVKIIKTESCKEMANNSTTSDISVAKSPSNEKPENQESSALCPECPRTLRSQAAHQSVLSLQSKGTVKHQFMHKLKTFKTFLLPVSKGKDKPTYKIVKIPVKKIDLSPGQGDRKGLFESFNENSSDLVSINTAISDSKSNNNNAIEAVTDSYNVNSENANDTASESKFVSPKNSALESGANIVVSGAIDNDSKVDEETATSETVETNDSTSLDDTYASQQSDRETVKVIIEDICKTVTSSVSNESNECGLENHDNNENSRENVNNEKDDCENLKDSNQRKLTDGSNPVPGNTDSNDIDAPSISDVEKRIDEIQAMVCDIKKEISISQKSAKRRRSSGFSETECDVTPNKKTSQNLSNENVNNTTLQMHNSDDHQSLNLEDSHNSDNSVERRTRRKPSAKVEYMMYMCELKNSKRQKLNKSPLTLQQTDKSSVNRMLKKCKPCSVVLVDFVKCLDLNQLKSDEELDEVLPLKPKAPLPKLFQSISPSTEDEEVDVTSVSPPHFTPAVCTVQPIVGPRPSKKRNGNYQCKTCPYSTSYKMAMEDHVYIHCDHVPFKCGYCSGIFGTRSGTVAHHKRNHPNQPLIVIKSGGIVESDYYTHQRVLHAPVAKTRRFRDILPSLSNIQAHSSDSESNCSSPRSERFQCRYCHFGTSYKDDIDIHYNTQHEDEKYFVCPLCDLSFCRKSEAMQRHYAKWHPDDQMVLKRACGYYDMWKTEDLADYNKKALNKKFNEQHFVRREINANQICQTIDESSVYNSSSPASSQSNQGSAPQETETVTSEFSPDSVTMNFTADEDNDAIVNVNVDSPSSLKILNVMSLQQEETSPVASSSSTTTTASVSSSSAATATTLSSESTPHSVSTNASKDVVFVCKRCPERVVADSLVKMSLHFETVHSDLDFWFGCPHCPFGCSKHRHNITRHIKRAHPRETKDVEIHMLNEELYIQVESKNANRENSEKNVVVIGEKNQPSTTNSSLLRQQLTTTPSFYNPTMAQPPMPSTIHHFPMPMMPPPPQMYRPFLPREYEKYQVFNIKPPNFHRQQRPMLPPQMVPGHPPAPVFTPAYGYPGMYPQYGMQPGYYYPPPPYQYQPYPMASGQPVPTQSFPHPMPQTMQAGQPMVAGQPVPQPMPRPMGAGQPIPQPMPQPMGAGQPVPQPMPQPMGAGQPIPQPMPQLMGAGQPIPQPMPQPIPAAQSIAQPLPHQLPPVHQNSPNPISQPISQNPVDESSTSNQPLSPENNQTTVTI